MEQDVTNESSSSTISPDVEPPFATIEEAFSKAKENLEPGAWDYLEGGAGSEITLRANRAEFTRWQFRPRVMSGLPSPETSTTVLGIPLALPVLTAPFGADGMFAPEGHKAVAQANEVHGVISVVPEAGTFSMEDVASASPAAARICQLHPMGDPAGFRRMLKRIEAAGYSAICVTVDCPTAGWRERNLRNKFDVQREVFGGNYPAWWGPRELGEVFGQLFSRTAPVWSWDELAAEMSHTSLPWIAKGILNGEDAQAAVGAGASALVVSNHGGRQLDSAPPALAQLPEVVAAVGGRAEILLDSGIRQGNDIVKAVALGARAVFLGRPVAAALAAGGQAGVEHALWLLREEMISTLTLLGRGSITDLGPDAVTRSGS
ncbi:alpha-hydroxy acid oxidase [Streptomyces sp. NPDC088350]|uniref:alpha-hydroxy acid oxidase n=1 Tax=Streptomyces sp. NPDC088350 TaxID=3365854 RepID=UPI0038126371